MVGEGSAENWAYILWHSMNGGQTWTSIAFGAFSQSVSYPTVTTGVAQALNRINNPGGIAAIRPSSFIFTGWNPDNGDGLALLDQQGHWTAITMPSTHTADVPMMPAATSLLQFPSPQDGWMAGTTPNGQGALLTTQNGGQTWAPWPFLTATTQP